MDHYYYYFIFPKGRNKNSHIKNKPKQTKQKPRRTSTQVEIVPQLKKEKNVQITVLPSTSKNSCQKYECGTSIFIYLLHIVRKNKICKTRQKFTFSLLM